MSAPLLILALFISPVLFLILARQNIRYSWIWTIAAALAGASWLGGALSAWNLPVHVDWGMWERVPGPISGADWLLLDASSWPLGFALATLCFSAVLTALVRLPAADWRALAGVLSLTAVGLAAVFAGSFPALLLSWAALDIFELLVLLSRGADPPGGEKAVLAFAGNIAGTFLLLASATVSGPGPLSLVDIPASVSGWVLLAAGFRLGVLPIQPPLLPDTPVRRGLGTVLRLAPVAGAIVLASRAAESGVPDSWRIPLLTLSFLAGLVAVLNWLATPDDILGRPYWILGMGSLVVSAAVQGLPAAATAWGASLVFGGGLLFLRSRGGIRLGWLFGFTLLMMPGLAYSPTWPAAELIRTDFWPWGLLSAILASGLLAGYFRHGVSGGSNGPVLYGGVRELYLGGLILLPVSFVFSGWAPAIRGAHYSGGWWEAGVILLAAGGIRFAGLKGVELPDAVVGMITRVLSLRWFYRILGRLYRWASRAVAFISRILEGDSAVLWAILLLSLLLSLFAQLGLGE